MTHAAFTADISALRRDVSMIVAGLGALTDAVATQGRLLVAIMDAVTADEPEGSSLVDALIRIARTLENQEAGIEAVRLGLARLPDAVRTATRA